MAPAPPAGQTSAAIKAALAEGRKPGGWLWGVSAADQPPAAAADQPPAAAADQPAARAGSGDEAAVTPPLAASLAAAAPAAALQPPPAAALPDPAAASGSAAVPATQQAGDAAYDQQQHLVACEYTSVYWGKTSQRFVAEIRRKYADIYICASTDARVAAAARDRALIAFGGRGRATTQQLNFPLSDYDGDAIPDLQGAAGACHS